MSNNTVMVWRNTDLPALPKKTKDISELVNYGLQLSAKDQGQIVKGFESGSYEMVSTYVSTKAISSLKNQLSKMGVSFIAELLDRPDIDEYTNIQDAISSYEAVRLAEELAMISGTAAFRLKNAIETVSHFNHPELDDTPENELTEDETKTIIRSCIEGSLRYDKIQIPIDFKNFRDELENITLTNESPHVIKLVQSPYFFHRTTLRIILSIVKSAVGAQLENSLANANLIVPQIWKNLKNPEKYQVGRSYSELFADGKTKAASGLKKVLLKVKGFDFVPEDLRSTSFIKIANELIRAHEGMNNFYNEPLPMNTLYKMGSVIPIPAFHTCITAVLCVKLGNSYGVSNSAQDSANKMITSVTNDRWLYFFNECLQTNERILYKLLSHKTLKRWYDLFQPDFIDRILPEITEKDIVNLMKFTRDNKSEKIKKIVGQMINKIGYSVT
ncbi:MULTISPECIES: hypothetical protein [unclassified Tenacibaculum]|uniref:hypothetical protein n=1 Tax=unclassified Tenacibaculum TaxID=2635139 RepID=UPI001F42F1A5|nr:MULTISPECIES: hypothetical protein [unclassified Tenacibaculum]MCF2875933.1 hypothetical protein [Tenacibaculum sp. Cn5-1]MCF2936008.1 hypothetical protein [Tenacibaculum sp. Cn5-34]MCG7512569.1 hypothetical protein [Tenacibaculum sp. Cn5-46]